MPTPSPTNTRINQIGAGAGAPAAEVSSGALAAVVEDFKAAPTCFATSDMTICRAVASTFAPLFASGWSSQNHRKAGVFGPCAYTACCCTLLLRLLEGARASVSAEERSRKEASSWMRSTATLVTGARAAAASAEAPAFDAKAADEGAKAAEGGVGFNATPRERIAATSRPLNSFNTSTKASRIRLMVPLEQPTAPTPTKSLNASENPRAQVTGQDRATLTRNSGVIRLC